MTERSPGAPDPAEPSHSGDVPAPGARPSAAPPADLGAVRRTDAIIEALAERRAAGSEGGDTIVRLLRALVTDVDEPARDPRDSPEPAPPTGPGSGPRRRGPRTIVALGVAGAMLASTGVAAAGDRAGEHTSAASVPATEAAGEAGGPRTEPNDTEVASFERPAPAPVSRPAPEPGRPGRADDNGRADYERFRNRLERLLAQPPRYRRPGYPTYGGRPGDQGAKSGEPSDDARRRLDDIRRRTQKRLDRYQNYPYDR
ncbi:hypothetical protein AGRA3207_004940 [Actinomadura graeca]|uniref:Uncharacterized protein n=1 Tax=Actinomadura graeca TaxID=2750812 RepID=A0ABX8QYJ3_9ACTN|nr:hypothetical protein [Actinomadura graeca]QXJ23743.1 hypothetical protein AGRA3207_004940 [Actinomadura graeca]